MGRLSGKVAIVTGAGAQGPGWGNGNATAVLFAREGATILAVDLRSELAEETRAIIAGEGGTCSVFEADVSSAGSVKAMVEACLDRYGQIDVLHNNVGTSALGGPVETSEEDWDRIFRINVKSVFLTAKYCLPHMEQHGRGSIINIASIAGIRDIGIPFIAYSSSKAAVIQASQSIALQYAAKGIRCNVILPGLMNTPHIVGNLAEAYGNDLDRMIAGRDARSPTGKMGTGWDVAHAAVFLASDESAYVNGAQIVVDGGITGTVR